MVTETGDILGGTPTPDKIHEKNEVSAPLELRGPSGASLADKPTDTSPYIELQRPRTTAPGNGGHVESLVRGEVNGAKEQEASAALAADYFDRSTTGYIAGRILENDEETLARYKQAFTSTATRLFGDRLERLTYHKGTYNPMLQEFFSLLGSLDHNKGVYYQKEDVINLFEIVSDVYFNDPQFLDQLDTAPEDRSTPAATIIKQRAASFASVDAKRSTGLMKDEHGEWKVVDFSQLDMDRDHTVLEMTRQDNDDKSGWDKFRFRSATYSPKQDDVHTEQMQSGWFTSSWVQEPNYWSGKMRQMLQQTNVEAAHELANMHADVIFITDGGIYKGTGTADTDIDTLQMIVCDSKDDFNKAGEIVTAAFERHTADLPFKLKKEVLRYSYYDRSDGKVYFRLTDSDRYVEADETVPIGPIQYQLRPNEPGLVINHNGQTTLFAKPAELQRKYAYLSIDPSSGQVIASSDTRPRVDMRNQASSNTTDKDDIF